MNALNDLTHFVMQSAIFRNVPPWPYFLLIGLHPDGVAQPPGGKLVWIIETTKELENDIDILKICL